MDESILGQFIMSYRSMNNTMLRRTLSRTLIAPGYILLAYLIDFRMIKLYMLPIMLAKYGRGSISFQSPVTYQFEGL